MDKDNLKPFSYDEYKSILTRLHEEGYRIVDFRKALFLEKNCRFAVIRHDVDLDLDSAVKIAEIESKHDIKSTFFFLVSSNFYNILSKEGSEAVTKVLALGHGLGLHFDFSTYESESTACDKLKWEREILAKRFDTEIDAISYHCHRYIPRGYEGASIIIDVVREPFITEIKYFSDSYGVWRYGHPLESRQFKEGKPLHLNFHPWWWDEEPGGQILALFGFAERRDKALKWSISKNVWGF